MSHKSDFGPAELPDVGELAYNGVQWSCLYRSKIDGPPSQDEARRTTRYVEYTMTASGVVTLADKAKTTDDTLDSLRRKLSVHGGHLKYYGKGFGLLEVNRPGGQVWDVAYGPVPKVLSFQPLGGSRAALVEWQVTFRIAELKKGYQPFVFTKQGKSKPLGSVKTSGGGKSGANKLVNLQGPPAPGPVVPSPGTVLQFNYEATVSYDIDGYSSVSIKGTLEVPATRAGVDDRRVTNMVDGYRRAWLDIEVDLNKFQVVRRNFHYSRDKRTCEWDFSYEELPPMGLPIGATTASGSMSVRPARKFGQFGFMGPGVLWYVTLRASYTIRKDFSRRAAWWAFVSLLWARSWASANGVLPDGLVTPAAAPQQAPPPASQWEANVEAFKKGFKKSFLLPVEIYRDTFKTADTTQPDLARVYLTDFGFDEGLYKDSKSMSFTASWFLPTTFRSLFAATGVWQPVPGCGGDDWALSMKDIQGWSSWLVNRLDPNADVIVDMGGGTPPQAQLFGPKPAGGP